MNSGYNGGPPPGAVGGFGGEGGGSEDNGASAGVLDILGEEVVYGILKPVGEGARAVVAQPV